MKPIVTSRLRLIPATATLTDLEIEHLAQFFEQLEVEPASDWPSANLARALPFFREQLREDALLVGWLAWYWLLDTPAGTQLVGGGGFKGAPSDGMVEIGYETRSAFRRRGIATEAVSAQVNWALAHADVNVVVAETREDNKASIGVLEKIGFKRAGKPSESGLYRFECRSIESWLQ